MRGFFGYGAKHRKIRKDCVVRLVNKGFGFWFLVVVLCVIFIRPIVKYLIPALLTTAVALVIVFTLVGAFVGTVKAIANFIEAIRSASASRDMLYQFKSIYAADVVLRDRPNMFPQKRYDSLSNAYKADDEYRQIHGLETHELRSEFPEKDSYCYEDIAAKSYFFGPAIEDTFTIIKNAFRYNFKSLPSFNHNQIWLLKATINIWTAVQIFTTVVFGSITTLVLSMFFLVVFLLIEIPVLITAGISLMFENFYYLSHQIEYRCPSCKGEYKVPHYVCPNPDCGIVHKRLRPGLFGIRKRKCVCGRVILPLRAKARGAVYDLYMPECSSAEKRRHRQRLDYRDIPGKCPLCGNDYTAGLTKPTSIALIGGASAGKTTFKVAFSYVFLDEATIEAGLDYSFPDKSSETEYDKSIRYFKGLDIIPATNRGTETDISTFSFSLENKGFTASRMIHIYDMPGEVFETGDAKEGWRNYQFTEGMVFLIDPYSLPEIKSRLSQEIADGNMGICTMGMNELVDSLINTLRNEKVRKKGGKFAIPVALTINKVDSILLKRMCGGDAVSAVMQGCPEVFGTDYFMAVDYVCRCFLAKNGGMGFIANLDHNFNTVHFFFSSPMGYIPKSTLTRFRPVNVLQVMQWMMRRADSELARVWRPEVTVRDLTEDEKQLYKTHPEYYEQFVEPLITNGAN